MPDKSNTSGKGEEALVPEEIKRYNWGALFLGLLWAKFNGVPVSRGGRINPFLSFTLASQGNELSWKNKRWDSIEQFLRTQRRWAIAPLIFWAGFMLLLFSSLYFVGSPLVNMGLKTIQNHPVAIKKLGEPVSKGFTQSIKREYNKGGEASFSVRGSKTGGKVFLKTEMREGHEVIISLRLELDNGESVQLAP